MEVKPCSLGSVSSSNSFNTSRLKTTLRNNSREIFPSSLKCVRCNSIYEEKDEKNLTPYDIDNKANLIDVTRRAQQTVAKFLTTIVSHPVLEAIYFMETSIGL